MENINKMGVNWALPVNIYAGDDHAACVCLFVCAFLFKTFDIDHTHTKHALKRPA